MNKKFIKVLTTTFLLGSLSLGSVSVEVSAKVDNTQSTNQNNIIAGELLTGVKEDYSSGKRVITFFILNTKEKEEVLKYFTAQRYNYLIKDKDGKVLYDYSKKNMFAEVESEETVKQGETIEYKVEVDSVTNDLIDGLYTLVFNSTAQGQENLIATHEIYIKKDIANQEVKQTKVTYIGLKEKNSIEVKDSKGKRKVYNIEPELSSNFKYIKKNTKVTLLYSKIDGKNVVSKVEVESKKKKK